MAITVNIYYKGTGSAAKQFAKEMIESGTVDAIRNEAGNLRYDYFLPLDDEETVLLIDSWENQEAIDVHHASPMMNTIVELREKYNLHMMVERYVSDDGIPDSDKKFIKE
ncbi:antibiotic biosynthesis monooxygenase [bacterium]|nr:antibiotic biosynthesis monooxygenase [bacterium]MDY3022471.1 putative quinol monooxygenase [Oliverpabstia sp.]